MARGYGMTLREKVFSALNVPAVTDQLAKDANGRSIYHIHSPDAGSYPILIYSAISDVPALTADGVEQERRATVRVHICTKDAVFEGTYQAVNAAMLDAGFMRYQTNEIFTAGIFILVCDYTIGIGVDE